MKTLLVLVLGLLVVGCGDGELRDCDAACKRYFKCCEDIFCDGDPYTMEDCMSMCESANKITNANALKGFDKCSGIPCEQHERREECKTQAIQHCTDDHTKVIEAVCSKEFECQIDGYPTIEKCHEMVGLRVGCYNQRAVDAYLECSQSAGCETYHGDLSRCFMDEMDISWNVPWYFL